MIPAAFLLLVLGVLLIAESLRPLPEGVGMVIAILGGLSAGSGLALVLLA